MNAPCTNHFHLTPQQKARLGELLLAGLRIGATEPQPPAGSSNRERQSVHTTIGAIRSAFELHQSWSPTALREQLGLTSYQTKAALRQLTSDGFVVVSGKTRAAIYMLASAGTVADLKRSA